MYVQQPEVHSAVFQIKHTKYFVPCYFVLRKLLNVNEVYGGVSHTRTKRSGMFD